MTQIYSLIFIHYQLLIVMLGTSILGIVAGALGPFALLRRQSLLGDAISHAALPGVALAFLFTYSKEPVVIITGGAVAGIIGTVLALAIKQTTQLKFDAILGIILSVFFGFGLVLMSEIQKRPIAEQAMISKFMFGNAAGLLTDDVLIMIGIGICILICLIFFWKEFKLIAFDPLLARSLGYPVILLDALLAFLLILAIVIGLQTVGVILMSTLFIAPACAARQWTDHLGKMVIYSCGISLACAIAGSLASSMLEQVPTGPAIVVLLSCVVGFSLVMGKK